MITANKKLFKIKTKLEKQNEINDILKMLENGVREVLTQKNIRDILNSAVNFITIHSIISCLFLCSIHKLRNVPAMQHGSP